MNNNGVVWGALVGVGCMEYESSCEEGDVECQEKLDNINSKKIMH